ncbi:MAG TPA: hypothetical protein VGK24_19100 [Candidatus Angelobacter sp.]
MTETVDVLIVGGGSASASEPPDYVANHPLPQSKQSPAFLRFPTECH